MILNWTIIAVCIVASCYGTFINYQPGYEYIYDFTSTLDVKTLHKLDAVGEIGLANIWNNSDTQELLLFVHKFRLKKVDINGHSDPEIVSHHLDFSRWFSFEISRRGEISNVIHPVNEHKDVTAIKNGIVSFLASRLRHPHEVHAPVMGQGDPDKWYYSADDIIKHGVISADYFARKTPRGHTFVKTFNTSDHKIPNGKITSQKNITIHDEIDTIQIVEIEDNFHMHFGSADRYIYLKVSNTTHGDWLSFKYRDIVKYLCYLRLVFCRMIMLVQAMPQSQDNASEHISQGNIITYNTMN